VTTPPPLFDGGFHVNCADVEVVLTVSPVGAEGVETSGGKISMVKGIVNK
jgi:hypothetical protein